jgi:uncharacterized membrane protein YbhN (UPF0104 family)
MSAQDVPAPTARQHAHKAWSVLQIAATLLLLAWAYARFDREPLRHNNLALGWLVLALACTAPAYAAAALRWSFTAQRLGVPVSFRRALPEVYLASFLNSLLPTGFAGDVLRAVRQSRSVAVDRSLYARAWLSVALERFAGQLVLWLLLLLSLAHGPLSAYAGVSRWWPLLVGLLVLPWLVVWRRRAFTALDVLLARGPARFDASLRVDLWPALRRALFADGALGVQLATSCTVLACCTLGFACCAKGLSVPLSFSDLLHIVPPVLALSALPLSIGGFGLREVASAALYAGSGLDAGTGVLVASTYGLLNLLGSAPGALFVWLRRRAHGES